MDIDARKPIAGIKPALLKRLFRKERFDTPTAMKWLQCEEPEITRKLCTLEREGWITFDGTLEAVDYWRPAEKGRRLRATGLRLKRIPVAEGRRLLGLLVEEARAINVDPACSRRVESIRVFGSVLNDEPDCMIGDVDVVAEIKRRTLPEGALKTLEDAENARRPGRGGLEWYAWSDMQLFRRLAAVSRYISLHTEGDLRATAAPYQQVYAYDLARECEVEIDPEIRRMTPPPALNPNEPRTMRPMPRSVRRWPTAPNRKMLVHLDQEEGLVAQHMWMNGADTTSIAGSLGLRPADVHGYLSSRSKRRSATALPLHPSLKTMVLDALPHERAYAVFVSVSVAPNEECLIDVELRVPRTGRKLACLCRVGRSYRISGSPPEHVVRLESVDRAAAAWADTMQVRLRGVGAEISVHCLPEERKRRQPVAGAKFVDVSQLKKPLLELLDTWWPRPRDRYAGVSARLAVSLAADPTTSFSCEGTAKDLDRAMEEAVDHEMRVTEAAQAVYARFQNVLDDGSSWCIYVTGDMLEQ